MGQTLFLALCTDYAFNPITAELHTTIPVLHEPHLVEITQRGARGGSEAPALHCLTRGQGLRPHAGRLLRARHCDSTFSASSHFIPTAAPQGGQCHLLCLTEARSSPERLSPEGQGVCPQVGRSWGSHTTARVWGFPAHPCVAITRLWGKDLSHVGSQATPRPSTPGPPAAEEAGPHGGLSSGGWWGRSPPVRCQRQAGRRQGQQIGLVSRQRTGLQHVLSGRPGWRAQD